MRQGKNIDSTHFQNNHLLAIDWALCIKLANNKEAIAQEILALTLQQLPNDLTAIKEAQEKADYAELLRCVHRLHGALCYSGMTRLKTAVFQLECALKQDHLDPAMLCKLYSHLEAEAETVLSCPLPY